MNEILKGLEPKEWLELNAKLQQKKNAVRKVLKEKGILKKGATNTFDKYSYFSEAQYKQLFTELFSEHGLELKFTELEYNTYESSGKQPNGRMPKLEFSLIDTDTGFFETTTITGEGIDKGDKAGYKAYTGALKYFLADTFMVATGDDTEDGSPDHNTNSDGTDTKAAPKEAPKATPKEAPKATPKEAPKATPKASEKQIELIKSLVDDIPAMLGYYKINSIEELNIQQASEIIAKKKGVK